MKHRHIRTYRLLLAARSVVAIAMGLFVPFWIIFIQGFGQSIETFGFALGLMALAQALTAYFIGRHSDFLGRKPFLIMAGFATSGVIIGYTFITSLIQLYVLQVLDGIMTTVDATMEQTLLADVTEKVSRGADIGKYRAITGVLTALAMMSGGYIVGQLGINIIFYIAAGLIFLSTLALFYIKEE